MKALLKREAKSALNYLKVIIVCLTCILCTGMASFTVLTIVYEYSEPRPIPCEQHEHPMAPGSDVTDPGCYLYA